MKVFISHQKEDTNIAKLVHSTLEKSEVEAYLDSFDNNLSSNSQKLTEHLKEVMRESTDILVVMSNNTAKSWWVPFEIGMAANQNLPTVTYLQGDIKLPEYLDYWPCLKHINDIKKYIQAHKEGLQEERLFSQKSMEQKWFKQYSYDSVQAFYNRLKAML